MKMKSRIEPHNLPYVPKDGSRYVVILHDGRKVEGQWSEAAARFYLDQMQSTFVLRTRRLTGGRLAFSLN